MMDGLPFLPWQVLVPIANGSEEMEAVIITDVLRRAGMKVTLASVEDDISIEASRSVKIIADKLIWDVKHSPFDIIILPVMYILWSDEAWMW